MAMQPNRGKGSSGSAAAKRLAEEKANRGTRTDTRGNSGFGDSKFAAGRIDRNLLSGLGMTKAGVNRRAITEGNLESLNYMNGDVGFMYPEYGNDIDAILGFGGPVTYDIPYEEIEQRRLDAENAVRNRFGMPALTPIESGFLMDNGRQGRQPNPYRYLNYGRGPKWFAEQTRPGYIEYNPRFGGDVPGRIGGY